MRTLFTIDKKNYTDDMPVIERFAVRALINRNGLWAMQKSNIGDYKIPGGGVEKEESYQEALLREVQEETGLLVIPETIREIGEVVEMKEDSFEKGKKYIAHSFYYFCGVREEKGVTSMTENELKRGYQLEWADIDHIIKCNEKYQKEVWAVRDTQFIKWLKDNIDK